MIEDYLTVNEVIEKWILTPCWVRDMCVSGKIDGAVQFGRSWAIFQSVEKPSDERVTTGKYQNWRNINEKQCKEWQYVSM